MKTLKVIILLSLLTLCKTSFSQCQPVCIVGTLPTFTIVPSGTQSVVVTNTVTTRYAGTQTVSITGVTGTVSTNVTNTVSTTYAGTQTVNVNNPVSTVTVVPSGTQSVVVTNTVATTGNWCRQDTNTKHFNLIYPILIDIDDEVNAIDNNTAQTYVNVQRLNDTVTNGNKQLRFQSAVQTDIKANLGLLKDTTINGNKQLRTIANKVSGTLTVSVTNSTFTTVPSGTQSVTVTNTVSTTYAGTQTVNISNTGTVAITGTPTVAVTNTVTTTPAVTTVGYTLTTVTGAGTHTITTGARAISISNTGSATAQINGQNVPVGFTMNMQIATGVLYPQITYDSLTSTLIVSETR